MTVFREFYVPPGAGSNFLAGRCLWTTDVNDKKRDSIISTTGNRAVNEYSFDREKVNKQILTWRCDDADLLSETKKIIPILIELSKIIKRVNFVDTPKNASYRSSVISDTMSNSVWKRDCSYQCLAFTDHLEPNMYSNNIIPAEHVELLQQCLYYFSKCRGYYFKVCEQNDWNSFIISHKNPYESTFHQLKQPKNFRSMTMKEDVGTNIMIGAMQSIKKYGGTGYFGDIPDPTGEVVSYRKIFFENDGEEIRRMYEFFENKEYFDNNRMSILEEFKVYHLNNMEVLKQHSPTAYEKITDR